MCELVSDPLMQSDCHLTAYFLSRRFVLDFCRPPRGMNMDPAYSVVKSMLGKGGHVSQFINWSTYDHSNP